VINLLNEVPNGTKGEQRVAWPSGAERDLLLSQFENRVMALQAQLDHAMHKKGEK
jgi:hypothetical protein